MRIPESTYHLVPRVGDLDRMAVGFRNSAARSVGGFFSATEIGASAFVFCSALRAWHGGTPCGVGDPTSTRRGASPAIREDRSTTGDGDEGVTSSSSRSSSRLLLHFLRVCARFALANAFFCAREVGSSSMCGGMPGARRRVVLAVFVDHWSAPEQWGRRWVTVSGALDLDHLVRADHAAHDGERVATGGPSLPSGSE
jgi:hypothetical protein